MSDLLTTFEPQLWLLLRLLVITGIILGLEQGFRRRAARLGKQHPYQSQNLTRTPFEMENRND